MTDKGLKIYLDVWKFQHPFDDQRQARICLEAETMKVHQLSLEAAW